MTHSERTEVVDLPLPPHLLPIVNDGAGNLVCLDTKAAGEAPPVVAWYCPSRRTALTASGPGRARSPPAHEGQTVKLRSRAQL